MTRDYKFKIGQHVKTKDEDTGETVRGIVVDTTTEKVFIKWEDLGEPTEHLQSEYYKIRLA